MPSRVECLCRAFADAQKAVAASVRLPLGAYVQWSGQFEYLKRAEAKLKIVVPVTLLIIFLLLYLNFGRITRWRSASSRSPALTRVVMLIYLDHALKEVKAGCEAAGGTFTWTFTRADLQRAIILGASSVCGAK